MSDDQSTNNPIERIGALRCPRCHATHYERRPFELQESTKHYYSLSLIDGELLAKWANTGDGDSDYELTCTSCWHTWPLPDWISLTF